MGGEWVGVWKRGGACKGHIAAAYAAASPPTSCASLAAGFPRPPPGEGPRWVPTWPQLGSLEQRHRAAARLDPDDQAAVAKFIAEHGALPPGEAHTVYTAGAADVLYHQEFICKCYGDNSGAHRGKEWGEVWQGYWLQPRLHRWRWRRRQ